MRIFKKIILSMLIAWSTSSVTSGMGSSGTFSADGKLAFLRHNETVTVTSFSPDGRFIASGSWDGKRGIVRLFDVETKKCIHAFFGHRTSVSSISFSSNSKIIVSGSWGTIILFDIETKSGAGFFGLNCWIDSVVLSKNDTKIEAVQGNSGSVAKLSKDLYHVDLKIPSEASDFLKIPSEASDFNIKDITLILTNPCYTLGDFHVEKLRFH